MIKSIKITDPKGCLKGKGKRVHQYAALARLAREIGRRGDEEFEAYAFWMVKQCFRDHKSFLNFITDITLRDRDTAACLAEYGQGIEHCLEEGAFRGFSFYQEYCWEGDDLEDE
jgi:hypothetical protein